MLYDENLFIIAKKRNTGGLKCMIAIHKSFHQSDVNNLIYLPLHQHLWAFFFLSLCYYTDFIFKKFKSLMSNLLITTIKIR